MWHFSVFFKNKSQGCHNYEGMKCRVMWEKKTFKAVVFKPVPGAPPTPHILHVTLIKHTIQLFSSLVENPRPETGLWDKGDIQNVPWHSKEEFWKEVSNLISLLVTCNHFLTPTCFGQAQKLKLFHNPVSNIMNNLFFPLSFVVKKYIRSSDSEV